VSPRTRSTALTAVVVLAVLLAGRPAAAQTAFGVRWYGEVRSPAPPRTLALGGISAVLPWGDESASPGTENPALAAFGDQVVFGFTWELGRLSGDYPDGTGTLWQTGPRHMGLTASLGRGLALQVGLLGLTTSDFEIHTDNVVLDDIPVQLDYLGTGGLNAAAFGVAWRSPQGRLAAGAALDMVFGSVKQEWRVDFEPSGYLDTADRLQRQHRGERVRLGLQAVPLAPLRVGASVTLPTTLDVDLVYDSDGVGADTLSSGLELGSALNLSAGYALNDLWSAYFDWRSESWDTARWTDPPTSPAGIGTASGGLDVLRPEWGVGIGVERRARPLDEQATLLDALPLRLGVRFGGLYAPDLNGGEVGTWSVNLGTGFFWGRRRLAWSDLALQYGRRTGADGWSESFWRIQIGLTGGEKWFQPTQR